MSSKKVIWQYNAESTRTEGQGEEVLLQNETAKKKETSEGDKGAGLELLHHFRRHTGAVVALVTYTLPTSSRTTFPSSIEEEPLDDPLGEKANEEIQEKEEEEKEEEEVWLLSAGEDRRLMLYNLTHHRFVEAFHNPLVSKDAEMAADAPITDIDVSLSRREVAYSSEDKLCYIRKLADTAAGMTLAMVLIGHTGIVWSVRWNELCGRWVTGSEDRTIRIWDADQPMCLQVVNIGASVMAIGIDLLNGCVLAGTAIADVKIIDVTLANGAEVVRKLNGHAEGIHKIVHIPDRRQYLSASSDGTIKVWTAYVKANQRRWLHRPTNAEPLAASSMRRYTLDPTQAAAIDTDDHHVTHYADVNPLQIPKTLSKGTAALTSKKFNFLESDAEDAAAAAQKQRTKLEEELLSTLNSLEIKLQTQNVTEARRKSPRKTMTTKSSHPPNVATTSS